MVDHSQDSKTVVMPLSKALHILATIHTRDDNVTGFVVEFGLPSFFASPWSQEDYLRAWASVRAHMHMQTEPPPPRPIPIKIDPDISAAFASPRRRR